MKKLLACALVTMLALSLLAACGGGSSIAPDAGGTSASPSSSVAAPTPEPIPSSTPEPSEPPHTHVWAEANYQAPKTCTECGETEGGPVTPAFDVSTVINMVVGTAYDYTTPSYRKPSLSTTGTVTITDYKSIASDETHEPMDGYEWKIVSVYAEFTDNNAWEYGMLFRQKDVDYYSGEIIDYYTNQDFYPKSAEDEVFSVNYLGDTYECFTTVEILQKEWVGRVHKFSYIASYLVPAGYDGCILIFHSGEHESDHEDAANTVDFPAVLADANTLYFRLAH